MSSSPSSLPTSSSLSPSSLHPSEIKNFINGKFVEPIDGAYFDDVNPATAAVNCKVARSNDKDVQLAVSCAQSAFPAWSTLSYTDRAAYLDRLADAIQRKLPVLAVLESLDTGKPIGTSTRIDIPRAIANFRFFAGAIRHDFTECHKNGNILNYTQRQPIGVAGLITPWNLPLYLLSWKVAPALAMGNTVVAKPSELTPLTANALAEIAAEILPPGVLNIVHGLGAEAGNPLVIHPNVELVSFTGGTVTGKHVATSAAPLFKKLGLELGGKNATVVFADANFEEAVAGTVRSSFTNQGQICLCGSRIFVQQPIYDRFLQAVVKRVQETVILGDPFAMSTTFGSVSSTQHLAKIEYYVALGLESGGKIECGGRRPAFPSDSVLAQGAFYEPTIISGLPPDHRCAREEIFGPVVTVHPFSTLEEVLKYTNDMTRYGLAGSLWTSDLNTAHRVSAAWQTGMVWVNCWLERDLRVPFGGVKESGVGTEGGRHSLEFYSNTKNIAFNIPGLL